MVGVDCMCPYRERSLLHVYIVNALAPCVYTSIVYSVAKQARPLLLHY